jgi:hypothetical protein
MNSLDHMTPVSRPRWDGGRVLFEVTAGDERVRCAISRAALKNLSGRQYFKAPELLQCFAKTPERIEENALAKLRARPEVVSGTLSIWADDLDDLPPTTLPLRHRRSRDPIMPEGRPRALGRTVWAQPGHHVAGGPQVAGEAYREGGAEVRIGSREAQRFGIALSEMLRRVLDEKGGASR